MGNLIIEEPGVFQPQAGYSIRRFTSSSILTYPGLSQLFTCSTPRTNLNHMTVCNLILLSVVLLHCFIHTVYSKTPLCSSPWCCSCVCSGCHGDHNWEQQPCLVEVCGARKCSDGMAAKYSGQSSCTDWQTVGRYIQQVQ